MPEHEQQLPSYPTCKRCGSPLEGRGRKFECVDPDCPGNRNQQLKTCAYRGCQGQCTTFEGGTCSMEHRFMLKGEKDERARIANLVMAEIDQRDPNDAGRAALLDVWHLIVGSSEHGLNARTCWCDPGRADGRGCPVHEERPSSTEVDGTPVSDHAADQERLPNPCLHRECSPEECIHNPRKDRQGRLDTCPVCKRMSVGFCYREDCLKKRLSECSGKCEWPVPDTQCAKHGWGPEGRLVECPPCKGKGGWVRMGFFDQCNRCKDKGTIREDGLQP